MSDIDLFKEIVRATQGVTGDPSSVSAALERIRGLISAATPVREEKSAPNRLERGGKTRSAE